MITREDDNTLHVEESDDSVISAAELFKEYQKLRNNGVLMGDAVQDTEYISVQETSQWAKNLPSSVADGIAQYLSSVEMDGEQLSDKELLGPEMENVINEFVLNGGHSEAATDFAVTMAYLRSDAFHDRLVRSFGYEHEEDIPEDLKFKFNQILEKAHSASEKTDLYFIKQSLSNVNFPVSELDEEQNDIVFVGGENHMGMSISAHEGGHALYREDIDVFPEYENTLLSMPSYQKLNESPSDDKQLRNTYGNILQELTRKSLSALAEPTVDDVQSAESKVIKSIKEHDDLRYERAADVYGVRMMMLREGIWNPFTGEDVTPEQVEEYQHRHPESRIFQYWDIKEATYFLNNIAANSPNKNENMKDSPEKTTTTDLALYASNAFEELSNTVEESTSRGVHL